MDGAREFGLELIRSTITHMPIPIADVRPRDWIRIRGQALEVVGIEDLGDSWRIETASDWHVIARGDTVDVLTEEVWIRPREAGEPW